MRQSALYRYYYFREIIIIIITPSETDVHDGLFIFSDLSGTNKSQTFILKHNMFRRLALVTCSTQLMILEQISLFPFVEK